MRRLATWFIVGFLGAVVVAATIAALVRNGDGNPAERRIISPSARLAAPTCRAAQLALSIEMRHDSPTVILRQVSGPSCDVGTLRISSRVRDQRGQPVLAQDLRSAFTGEISRDVDFIGGFVYTPLCKQKAPLVATVTTGPLTARHTVPFPGCIKADSG
jgi:hypothetical protein